MLLQLHAAILIMMPRPIMAHLLPFVPYKSSVDVTFRSVPSLDSGKMLDMGVLDFCVR